MNKHLFENLQNIDRDTAGSLVYVTELESMRKPHFKKTAFENIYRKILYIFLYRLRG